MDAYNEGDCERMISSLTEAAWSAGGDHNRDEFLERCTEAAEAREGSPGPISVRVDSLEVAPAGDDHATVTTYRFLTFEPEGHIRELR